MDEDEENQEDKDSDLEQGAKDYGCEEQLDDLKDAMEDW